MIGRRHGRNAKKEDAELDITSFMNLMIVLVPVLLMMMVFSRITVVELILPGIEALGADEAVEDQRLEVLVSDDSLNIFFPQGYLVKSITKIPAVGAGGEALVATGAEPTLQHDFKALQNTLKLVKQTLLDQGEDKKDIILMLPDSTDYQTIISLIDATRSYKEVLVTSVVDAELFPQVSLAEAPARYELKSAGGAQ
ncbi:MAG: biopolymer transport protein ExbD [Bermanella sp.]|jgi:biopolymer transport protein ExbD|uniref:ExbD/TolR family protein n=1 Tax=Glaciecola sp. 33A TaxID=2057807 RepID=UPI000C326E3C|nr:biopolymer transporter ExbD [Glaciecola sp. 33A]PKI01221.1 biopolymer transporter ExbD [Glaciecola sp. 33A]